MLIIALIVLVGLFTAGFLSTVRFTSEMEYLAARANYRQDLISNR